MQAASVGHAVALMRIGALQRSEAHRNQNQWLLTQLFARALLPACGATQACRE